MMATYSIPILETVKAAWKKLDGAKSSFWAAFGIVFVVSVIFNLLNYLTQNPDNVNPVFTVISLIGNIINSLLQLGIIYMGIRCAQNEPFTFRDMFCTFKFRVFIRLVGVYLLKILILLPFFLLLFLSSWLIQFGKIPMVIAIVIVGFCMAYVLVRILFGSAFVLDKGDNPWKAIISSIHATRGNFWRIILLFIIQGLIFILGVITLLIGLIWALPFGFILYGMIYKNLALHSESAQE